MPECLTIFGDHPQRCLRQLTVTALCGHGQALRLAIQRKRCRQQYLIGIGISILQLQLPVAITTQQGKIQRVAALKLALQKHRLCPFKAELMHGTVIGERDADSAEQRKQHKQPHAHQSRIDVTPGIGFTAGKQVDTRTS